MKKSMTVKDYLKDQWLLFLGWCGFVLLTILVMWLTPNYVLDWGTVGYLVLMEAVLLVIFLTIHFLSKRRFWQKLSVQDENLLQNYVTSAHFAEEEFYQSVINRAIFEHQEMLQQIIGSQEEQKDYIDSWVHEIKVPLAASQLLLRSVEFDIPDDKYILLENELNKIDNYVEQVLYVARLDSFSKDYLIQEESLKAIIQPVLKSQANYFIQKNIHLSIEGEDQQVLTDAKWIGFIFRQLLSNALKYTPDNGSITIRLSRAKQGSLLEVIDTGIGIPKEDLRRIFDKGFTGSNGRKMDTHSTGLGLYLAKNLAKQLGVSLTAESEINEGAQLSLFFPFLSFYEENRSTN